jgi:chromosome segregation ATPase
LDVREIEKARVALQERVRQLDAALSSKDVTCQGLADANEILKHELEAVKQDRDMLEEELDRTKEEVAALDADLKLANDSNRGKDSEVKSLAQLREVSSTESHALKERLAEKERELKEKTCELEALEAQSGELLGQFKMLQDRFQSIAADSGSVQDSVAEKDRVIAHLASEKDRAEEELAGLKEEVEQLKSNVTQLEHENARLEGEVEASSSSHFDEFQRTIQDKAQLQAELNSLKLGQQHESIRAQAKANRLESDLTAIKKEMEKGKREHQKVLRGKEEEIRSLEEEKTKLERVLGDWKNRLKHAQREKERLQNSVEIQKPVSSTLETLTARCEQLSQQNQALGEKLQQESSQRAEIERASGMVAAKLKQNARDEEKKLQRQIRDLSLEVERLRGRLSGMSTTQLAMRDHSASLEAALAKRESSLVKLSAQAQKVLEEKELEDQAFATQIATLEKQIEDSTKEGEAWKVKAHGEKKKAEELSQQLSQKEMELMDVKSLLEQSKQSGRSVLHLEEKIAELTIEKDDLLSQTSSLKTQLTVARTAVDITKKDLADRSSQVDILKRELDMAKSQRVQAESEARQLHERLKGAESRHEDEIGRLKEALRRERESSVMEERDADVKSGLFDASLSMISTEDVDKARSGMCTCMYAVFISVG